MDKRIRMEKVSPCCSFYRDLHSNTQLKLLASLVREHHWVTTSHNIMVEQRKGHEIFF